MADFVRQEFDEVKSMQGLVRYLKPLIGDYLGKLDDGVSPAIYIGMQDNPKADYPRVYLVYQGDSDLTSHKFEYGIVEVENPNDPPNTIEIPYSSQYVKYLVNVIVDSGNMDDVVQGKRKSSNWIAREIRKTFGRDGQYKKLHIETNSSIDPVIPIDPQTAPDGTRFYDSSVMTLNLSTIDTDFDFDGGWFTEVEYEGKLFRINDEDPDPIISTRTAGFPSP